MADHSEALTNGGASTHPQECSESKEPGGTKSTPIVVHSLEEVGHGNWVKLNVGGTVFTTTKSTLSKDPDSFLARLSSPLPSNVGNNGHSSSTLGSDCDHQNAFLIDRDPHYFGPVLNFLRHGKLVMDKNLSEEGVLEEAEFYNVKNLILLIKERIKKRDQGRGGGGGLGFGSNGEGQQNVYRILECFERELTNMVSTLSDGWKFEQLIRMEGPRYNSDTDPVFLCVVSKSFDAPPSRTSTSEQDQQPKDRAQVRLVQY